MAKKIMFWVGLLLNLCSSTLSQTPPGNICPIVSTQTDVEKSMGKGIKLGTNRAEYDLPNEIVQITYYDKGCGVREEKRLNLSKKTVLEVRVISKKHSPMDDALADRNIFKVSSYLAGGFLYFSATLGIVATTNVKNTLEITDEIYFIPQESKFPDCLTDSFDPHSSLSILNNAGLKTTGGDKFDYPPLRVSDFVDEDSTATKNAAIGVFSEKLLKHPNSYGFILLNQVDEKPRLSFAERRKMLVEEFARLGILCDKLVIPDGMTGGSGRTAFMIIHRSNDAARDAKPICKKT